MARKDAPLKVEIPTPADERPAWSRVGLIALGGFALGIVWPRLAGVRIGPSVPADARPQPEAVASASAAPAAAPSSPAAAGALPGAPAAADAGTNQQSVVIGPGKIVRCWDKKGKRVDDCGKLQIDPVLVPKLRELANCPAALGLDGKLVLGFEVDFQKKEVHVTPGGKKKHALPASTVQGVLQCAAREFTTVALEDVPAKLRRYSLTYELTFHPPGKAPAPTGEAAQEGDGQGEAAAGTTTSETSATGTAAVTWDTALVRKEPKDGEVVARLVRGTRVKLVGRQNDWYRIEAAQKTGWIYRGAIGL